MPVAEGEGRGGKGAKTQKLAKRSGQGELEREYQRPRIGATVEEKLGPCDRKCGMVLEEDVCWGSLAAELHQDSGWEVHLPAHPCQITEPALPRTPGLCSGPAHRAPGCQR